LLFGPVGNFLSCNFPFLQLSKSHKGKGHEENASAHTCFVAGKALLPGLPVASADAADTDSL
jgi:hypothetical protein